MRLSHLLCHLARKAGLGLGLGSEWGQGALGAGGGRTDGLTARRNLEPPLRYPPSVGYCSPHKHPPSSASFPGPPLSPPPPTICGYVSRSLTPLPCSMAALGSGAEFWDSCSFPSYFPTPQPPPSSRPRLSVGQFVCLLSPPPLWVFPARVMEPVAMATASVYRTHRSQSPLTLSIPAPHPHSLTQQ